MGNVLKRENLEELRDCKRKIQEESQYRRKKVGEQEKELAKNR
jgi:hypothetical protein